MKQVFELWDEAHKTYSHARAIPDENWRRRMLSVADGYLKRAQEPRRDVVQASFPNIDPNLRARR